MWRALAATPFKRVAYNVTARSSQRLSSHHSAVASRQAPLSPARAMSDSAIQPADMHHLVPYCVYDHMHWILYINTRDAREPIDIVDDPVQDVVYDNAVDYAVEKMLSWRNPLHRDSALHINASGEADAQWFTDLCLRLEDRSVVIGDVWLNVNSYLPLHRITPKLQCKNLGLGFHTWQDNVPVISDNSAMLELLSESLASPTIRYVSLEVHEPLTLRRQQAGTLLATASKFTYSMSHTRLLAYPHQMPLADFSAANPRSLHLHEVKTHIASLIDFLATVQSSLVSLKLEFECAEPVEDSTLQALSQSLRAMPQLRALALATGCHNAWLKVGSQSECLVVRLLRFATALSLDSLHIVVNERFLQIEHRMFGYAAIQQQVRTALADSPPSCRVTVDVRPEIVRQPHIPEAYSNSEYQLLFDEVQAVAAGLHGATEAARTFPSARHADR